jgi:hypothetical protein
MNQLYKQLIKIITKPTCTLLLRYRPSNSGLFHHGVPRIRGMWSEFKGSAEMINQ